jgi:GTPase-associated system helical domain
MHKDFAEWYRSAGITPNGEMLPKRWAAIEEYQAGRDEIVSLARLFCRLGKSNDAFLNTFRASFQKADPAFPMRDNDQELVVLAGAELVDTIQRGTVNVADFAALSLICAVAQNTRGTPAVIDIPEIAVSYLGERSIDRAVDGDGSDGPGTKALFAALTALGAPHDGVPKEFERLQRELSVVSEESNILWWLFSEYSRDLKEPWRKFGVPAVALMAAKELADLTRVIPGHVAATAFLDRVIRCAKSKPPARILVTDAIKGVTPEWRQRYASQGCPAQTEDLLPISHGLKISLMSSDEAAWVSAFTQGTGIRANVELPPNILAYQLFLEALLCRAWKAVK